MWQYICVAIFPQIKNRYNTFRGIKIFRYYKMQKMHILRQLSRFHRRAPRE